MLRDLTDSDAYNSVSVYARDTFIRLINKACDFGIVPVDAKLRVKLFPLLIEEVREADMHRWLAECEKAVLVRSYDAHGKRYIQIARFRQRLRTMKRKYPFPPWGATHPDDDENAPDTCPSSDGHATEEGKGIGMEEEGRQPPLVGERSKAKAREALAILEKQGCFVKK